MPMLKAAFHVFFALLSVISSQAEKVQVKIYIESGCPFCRKYLAGPLHNALADKVVAEHMDVDINPFGNAFYLTKACCSGSCNASSSDHYDVALRQCFNKECGAKAGPRPTDCFSGRLICQHGTKECTFNRYFACAKHASHRKTSNQLQYLPFIRCAEEVYDKSNSSFPPESLLVSCADESGIAFEDIKACYDSDVGDGAVKREAMATPIHKGVPWITINGVALDESYESDALRKAVLSARERMVDKKKHDSADGTSLLLRSTARRHQQLRH
jgi:predicted DsbA family dithiol-disulfide isomerase